MTAKELMERREDKMWRSRDTEFILAQIRKLEEGFRRLQAAAEEKATA